MSSAAAAAPVPTTVMTVEAPKDGSSDGKLALPDFDAPRTLRDIVFGVLFVISFLATVGYGIHGLLKLSDHVQGEISMFQKQIEELPFGDRIRAELDEGIAKLVEDNAKPFVQTLLVCAGASLVFSLLYLVLLERFVHIIVRIVITLTILSAIAFIAVNVVIVNIPFVIIGVIFLIYKSAWYWFMRKRMLFARRVVKASIRAMVRFGLQIVLLISSLCLLQALWCALCAGAYFAVQKGSGFEALLFLSFVWALEVIANVGHVAICATLGKFFVQGQKSMLFGLKTAFWYGFGSIAFGSLLVALLKLALYFFRKWKKSKNPIVKWCGLCCFCCLKSILQFFNTYAFVRVAMFNENYWTAAKGTVAMLRLRGLDAVAGNVLVRDLIAVGTSIGALIAGTTAAVMSLAVFDLPLVVAFCAVVLALLIGYAVLYVPLAALESSVATFFTVWHADRTLFKDYKGYNKLIESFDRKSAKKLAKQKQQEEKQQQQQQQSPHA
jgi:hypothetical protein